MSCARLTLLCSTLLLGCTVAPGTTLAPASGEPQKTHEEVLRDTNAMIDSISARLSEQDLAAAVASEHVALLDQRADKLRARCDRLPPQDQLQFEPHLTWLAQVHDTTTLAIGVLRNDSRDFDEDKAEVLLWTKVFMKEIDSLERRIDRIAPVNVLLSQKGS